MDLTYVIIAKIIYDEYSLSMEKRHRFLYVQTIMKRFAKINSVIEVCKRYCPNY